MMRFSLSELASIAGGEVVGADVTVHGMIHDARRIVTDNLFCALPGSQHDGHEFLAQARAGGAAAALVARRVDDKLPQVVVENVLEAMGRIARAWREKLDAVVVGITGSNGKTTVKEMVAAILSRQGETLATHGNYNNEIGVPLTLSALNEAHRFSVIEMGANGPGDIAYLAGLARPSIGIVTNAAPAHLEGFGSVEGVARTKGEMFSALPEDGVAIINADDPHAELWHRLAGDRQIITFGLQSEAQVRGEVDNGRARVITPTGEFTFSPQLPGRHNLYNALAASAAAIALAVPPDVIAEALSAVRGVKGRLQVRHHPDGWRLVDDTYNANPASLYAGLQVLAEMGGEHWLVLGDMGELGPDAKRLHAEMGQAARDLGVTRLYSIGDLARASADAFGPPLRHFKTRDALADALARDLRDGVTCLVKASRSMGLERVVEHLLGEATPC
jgi:UDP-N-acetylmuramoyl-tripeptide--D-alanyl-D-alanine ligase